MSLWSVVDLHPVGNRCRVVVVGAVPLQPNKCDMGGSKRSLNTHVSIAICVKAGPPRSVHTTDRRLAELLAMVGP